MNSTYQLFHLSLVISIGRLLFTCSSSWWPIAFQVRASNHHHPTVSCNYLAQERKVSRSIPVRVSRTGGKKRKKKKQRRLRQPYWPRQQSLITGCRGLYCSDEHEIRPEMRSPRLYSDDRVIMIIDVTDGSIFCTICVFNRFFSSFFQPSHFVASGLDFEVSGALHLSSTQVEGNQRPLAFNTQQLCSVLSLPIHRQLSKRTDGISSSRRIEKPKWITCVCCSSIVFRNWRLRANTAHYLSAGPYYIDVLSSACIAELLLINSDDIGFREGHLSLSTAINVVPYSPLPEEKKTCDNTFPHGGRITPNQYAERLRSEGGLIATTKTRRLPLVFETARAVPVAKSFKVKLSGIHFPEAWLHLLHCGWRGDNEEQTLIESSRRHDATCHHLTNNLTSSTFWIVGWLLPLADLVIRAKPMYYLNISSVTSVDTWSAVEFPVSASAEKSVAFSRMTRTEMFRSI